MSNKAIYIPDGRAREYAEYACNFYIGCSNQCDYCFNRRYPLLSGSVPTLKKAFQSEAHALGAFNKELRELDSDDFRRRGVTFSFTTDPMQPECLELTVAALRSCLDNDIPATILTKLTDWRYSNRTRTLLDHPKARKLLAIGFTITGHDEREPHASSNRMRMDALRMFYDEGYITYVSVEPVIDYPTALDVIRECAPYAHLLKIGLMAHRHKPAIETVDFINSVRRIVNEHGTKVYWKQSIRNCIGGDSPLGVNFVESDWNIFRR